MLKVRLFYEPLPFRLTSFGKVVGWINVPVLYPDVTRQHNFQVGVSALCVRLAGNQSMEEHKSFSI